MDARLTVEGVQVGEDLISVVLDFFCLTAMLFLESDNNIAFPCLF